MAGLTGRILQRARFLVDLARKSQKCGRGGIGRRARLRIWWFYRGGSSPFARTSVTLDPIHFGFSRFLYPFDLPQAASFLLHLDSVAPDPIHFGFGRFLYPFARPQAASFLLHLDSVTLDPIHFGFSRFLYPFARLQAAYFLLHLDSVTPDPIHFGFSRFLYPFARPQAASFLLPPDSREPRHAIRVVEVLVFCSFFSRISNPL